MFENSEKIEKEVDLMFDLLLDLGLYYCYGILLEQNITECVCVYACVLNILKH